MSNPTLITTITSSEPHIVGKYVTFTSVLQSQTGDPIPDKQIYFRTPTQVLGTLSTNKSGIIYFAIGVPQKPGTFEIYSTHITDDYILIESNHVIFTTEDEYTPTSLTISIDPPEVGPDQISGITGKLTIQGQDTVPPDIPLKLYCDKGQGYQIISTTTTPPTGTGTVTVQYVAQHEDVGKTLKFKYGYDGSDTLKLNPSESGIVEVSVVEIPTTIDTPEYTGPSVLIPVICGTVIGLGVLGFILIRR